MIYGYARVSSKEQNLELRFIRDGGTRRLQQ